MKSDEIIAQIRQQEPQALGKIADPVANRLLRASLAAIRKSIEACEEGRVSVMGLGVFIVRKAPAPEGGEAMRVVRFIASKPFAAVASKVGATGKSNVRPGAK